MPYPFNYSTLGGGGGAAGPSGVSNQPSVIRQPGWRPMPRPPIVAAAPLLGGYGAGFGQRSMWPLPPVGEAQRRDPHIGDGSPSTGESGGQANASPEVHQVTTAQGYGARPGNGMVADGLPPGLVFIKRIGHMVTSALSKNVRSGIADAQWRVGGIGYPPDFGLGPGAHADAETLYPGNPQTYLRNPGIIPLTNVPTTWRYAPTGGIQALGPSIADVGNFPAPAQAGPP